MAFKGTKGLQTSTKESLPQEDDSPTSGTSFPAPKSETHQETTITTPKFGKPVAKTDSTPPVSTPVHQEEVNDDLVLPDFLQQKKDPVADSMNDSFRLETTKKSAYQMTLKTLNALKIVSPIISALMQKPGVDATNAEMTDAFRSLIQEISIASAKTCEKMEIDPEKEKNFWIRNVLEKNFSEIFKNQWVATGEVNSDKLLDLMSIVIEKSDTFADKSEITDFDTLTTLKVATIRSVSKVLNEALTHFD